MLRPWWAVVRPSEYALERGIAGGLALIFARSVGSLGKLERGIWWAWLPGRGFKKLTNAEVRTCDNCTDLHLFARLANVIWFCQSEAVTCESFV